MTHGIRKAFSYRKRHEHGTQHPLDTLQTRSGTCRDYALFMIEALRRLGIAARFVSGYLWIPDDRTRHAAISAADRPMPGYRSICRARAGSNSIPPTASSAPATSFASRWRAIRARRSRCTARIWALPMLLSAWRSTSTWSPPTKTQRQRSEHGNQGRLRDCVRGMQPTPMVICSTFILRASPTSSAPKASLPNRTCRSASIATVLAMSAAGWWPPRAASVARQRAGARSGLPDAVVPTAQQVPIDQLPDDVLHYLLASRYCETDKLTDVAWGCSATRRRAGHGYRPSPTSCTTTSPSAISTPTT